MRLLALFCWLVVVVRRGLTPNCASLPSSRGIRSALGIDYGSNRVRDGICLSEAISQRHCVSNYKILGVISKPCSELQKVLCFCPKWHPVLQEFSLPLASSPFPAAASISTNFLLIVRTEAEEREGSVVDTINTPPP